jgi:hypothetical protein
LELLADELQKGVETSNGAASQEAKTSDLPVIKVEAEKVIKAWQDFASQRKENASEYTVLNRNILWDELNASLIVQFENDLLLTNFNKIKPVLHQHLVDTFGFKKLEIITEVIENLESATKPLYTNRDKYEHLAKQNPLFQEFVKRLGLELE